MTIIMLALIVWWRWWFAGSAALAEMMTLIIVILFFCVLYMDCGYACLLVTDALWYEGKKVTRTEPVNWRNFPQFVIKIPKKLFLMIHTCSLGCLSFYFCCNVAPLTSCKQYEHQHHHHLLHMLLYKIS